MIDRTVHIVSLGCPKNKVDAEVMAAMLAGRNFQITPEPLAAEVILINTCAFILPAKEEAIDEILRMARYKKTGALKYLVLTGCLDAIQVLGRGCLSRAVPPRSPPGPRCPLRTLAISFRFRFLLDK